MTKFIANNRTDALKTDINLFFTITNGQIARSRSLTRRTNFKFMCERARISAVIVKIVFVIKKRKKSAIKDLHYE